MRLIWDSVQVPNLKLKSLFMTDIQQPTHDVICKPPHIAPVSQKAPPLPGNWILFVAVDCDFVRLLRAKMYAKLVRQEHCYRQQTSWWLIHMVDLGSVPLPSWERIYHWFSNLLVNIIGITRYFVYCPNLHTRSCVMLSWAYVWSFQSKLSNMPLNGNCAIWLKISSKSSYQSYTKYLDLT